MLSRLNFEIFKKSSAQKNFATNSSSLSLEQGSFIQKESQKSIQQHALVISFLECLSFFLIRLKLSKYQKLIKIKFCCQGYKSLLAIKSSKCSITEQKYQKSLDAAE